MSKQDPLLLEDDGGSYLISVSDMMSGLLFIFIITLMAFVINLLQAQTANRQAQRANERARQASEATIQRLTNARDLRAEMLSRLQSMLANKGIQVQVSAKRGVLRLHENAVKFASGKATLSDVAREHLRTLAQVLALVLPCYSASAPPTLLAQAVCKPSKGGKLDAVFIEGHTDNVPVGASSPFKNNWALSAARAIEAYRIMKQADASLFALKNASGQPLFSVSGYGSERPMIRHNTPTPEKANRRIDIRFIMAPPAPPESDARIPIIRDVERAGGG